MEFTYSSTSVSDLNQIRTLSDLFVSLETSFLYLESNTITDVSGNSIVPAEAIQASLYIDDTTNPAVLSFDLDMNAGILYLHFSEVVDTSGLNISAISLQRSSFVVSSSDSYSLSGGSVLPMDVTVSIQLSVQDLNQLKTLSIGIDSSSVSLSISEESGIVDSAGSSLGPLANGVNTLPVSQYTQDTTPPELIEFSLDLNLGTLWLTFSETIDVSTFNLTSITLQNAASSPETTFSLSSSSSSTVVNEPTLNIALSMDDLNEIKRLPSLATSVINTYLSIQTGGVVDVFANDVVGISTETALLTSVVIPDTTRPILASFTLDLTSEVLILTFSETVIASSLYVPAVYLIRNSLADNTSSYRLTTDSQIQGGDPTGQDSTIIVVELGFTDLNTIKINEVLATVRSNTFLSINETLIVDTSANAIEPIPTGFPLQVGNFIPDTIAPTLRSFELDLNAGLLYLLFPESVRASSLHPPSITLQNVVNSSFVSAVSFTLTGGSSDSANGPVISLQITLEDLNNIKRFSDLATDIGDTYLSILEAAIHDMNFNPLVSIDARNALQSSAFFADITRPILVSYDINLNPIETLTLIFDETVRVGSLDPTQITVQSSRFGITTYNLSGGTLMAPDDPVQVIELLEVDVNSIKGLADLATSADNTFISLTSQLIEDTSGNQVEPVLPEAALQVFTYSEDTTSPVLLSFDFNLTSETLQFVFDEPVNVSFFQPTALLLQGTPLTINSTYGLTGGTVFTENSILITLFLTEEDLNAIKVNEALATSVNDTFLSYTSLLVNDISENPIAPDVVQVSSFTPDTVPPVLVAFGLDLDVGSLDLEFPEPVRASTLNPLGVTLQSDSGSPLASYTLTGGSTDSQNGQQISLNFSENDLNNIKVLPALASDAASTYLSITSGFILDINLNPVVPISPDSAIVVDFYTRDITPPHLISFSTNFNAGLLVLTFDEPVNVSSIAFTQIILQSASSTNFTSYQLTSGFTNSSSGRFIEVYMTEFDIIEITLLQDLFVSRETAYLCILPDTIADVAGNFIFSIPPIQTTLFIADSTSPILLSFDFAVDPGELTLYFNEAVDHVSLNVSGIILQREFNVAANNDSYRLTNGSVIPLGGTVTMVRLTELDINHLKAMRIGVTNTSVWCVVDSGTIFDFSGVPLQARVNGESAISVSLYTPDTTRPQLAGFRLDLTREEFILLFNEAIDVDSFDPTRLHLAAGQLDNSTTYALTGGLVAAGDTVLDVVLKLTESDLNAIKVDDSLATTIGSTYLSFDDTLVLDTSGNSIQSRSANSALQANELIPDQIPPSLLTFGLDMDEGGMLLTFSEPVRVATLSYMSFSIQNAPVFPNVSYSLIGGLSESDDGVEVIINLLENDLNGLKSLTDLGTDRSNTYLSVTSEAIQDTNANQLSSTPPASALQVNVYTADTTPPILLQFDLDMDTGLLTLVFDETVNTDSINLQGFQLQSNESIEFAEASYQLTGAISIMAENFTTIKIYLLDSDLNEIKLFSPSLATDELNTFLSFFTIIEDTSGLSNIAIPPNNAIQVRAFTADSTGPELLSFDIDFTTESISLMFSETVAVSTIDITQITILMEPGEMIMLYNVTLLSTTASTNGQVVQIDLSSEDSNTIKMLPELAVSRSTTYISVTDSLIFDTNGNPNTAISPPEALQVSNYVGDEVCPILDSFQLDVDAGLLLLTFSETVNGSSLDRSSFTLQNASNLTTSSLVLETTAVTLPLDTSLVLQLTNNELNQLKRIATLATSIINTWISVEFPGIYDTFGNALVEIQANDALQAAVYVFDETQPLLLSFTIDLDSGMLSLSFDETVSACSLTLTEVTLQNSGSIMFSTIYTFTGGTVLSSDDPVLVTELLAEDVNSIKGLTNLATSATDTFLSLTEQAVEDMNGNPITFISPNNALPVLDFIPDMTSPNMLSFSLNLTAGEMQFVFDETVNVSSFDPTELLLISDTSPVTNNYTLTGGLVSARSSTVIALSLAVADLNAIKLDEALATSISNTFLTFAAQLVTDTNRNQIAPVSNSFALQVGTFTEDVLGPHLISFQLDLNTGLLQLTFSEPIRVSSIDYTAFTLQNTATLPTVNYTLTNGQSASPNGLDIILLLSDFDLNSIKLIPDLATTPNTTYVSVTMEGIMDINFNLLTDITLQVASYTPDTTLPQLVSFTTNLNIGLLSLTFSEPVNASTLQLDGILLQNAANSPTDQISLTSVGTTSSQEDNTVITISVGLDDLNNIKSLPNLAVDISTTFLSISSGTVLDTSGNPIVPIPPSNAIQASTFTEDVTAPALTEFSLDINTGLLSLTFSETVNVSSLDTTAITLQTQSSGGELISLTRTSFSDSSNSPIVIISISTSDLNELKLLQSGSAIYLSVTSAAIGDMNSNQVEAIFSTSALLITDYIQDTTSPELVSYTADLNTGILILTFSEPVNTSSISFVGFTLQSENSNTSTFYRLTGGSTNSSDGVITELIITEFDLNQIKQLPTLYVSTETAFVSLLPATVQDIAGNSIASIASTEAIQAAVYTADMSRPVLLSFDLDMDAEILSLYFSEAIDHGTLNILAITIQADYNATDLNSMYRLTGGTASPLGNNANLIQLDTIDVNQLKTLKIGLSSISTWLAVDSGAILDLSGIPLLSRVNGESVIRVSTYTPDTTPPELVEFTLDLDLGTLWLTFSETVNATTFVPTSVTLQSTANNSDTSFSLSTGSLNSVFDEPIQRVNFTSDDLNEIKRLYLLATDVSSTFIAIQREAVLDVFDNEVVEITTSSAVQASAVVPDTTSPVLESYSLDLTAGELQLFFDETVNSNSFDPVRLQLIADPLQPDNMYSLTGGNVSLENSIRLVIILAINDLNAIKLNEQLATSQINTFLRLSSALVMDMNGNSVEAIIFGLQASEFIADVLPPALIYFELDVDSGLLLLSFSEPVRSLTLNPSRLFLQNENISPTSFVALTGSSSDSPNGLNIILNILLDNLNNIKEISDLATSSSDTFLRTTVGAIEDVNSNAVIESILQVGIFTPDTTPPLLVSFTANLNLGLLTLTFDEPVNASLTIFTEFILQSANSTDATFYQLTSGFTNSSNGRYIDLYMTESDVNEIKSLQGLFAGRETAYLRIDVVAIADVAGNPILSSPPSEAIQATLFIGDTSRPVLLSFDYTVDPGDLTLYFSEPVDHSSLNVSGIILQREFNVMINSDSYRLTNGSVIPLGDTVARVQLIELDTNHLKALRIGVTNASLWCVVDSTTIVDVSGISLEARINGESAISVSLYTPDTTRPQLVEFSLDLAREDITLLFSEAIDVASLDPTRLDLTAGQLMTSTAYSLTGGEVAPGDSVLDVVVKLTEFDLDIIKVDDTLATSTANTYLSFDDTLVLDTSGNIIQPRLANSALQAVDIILDQLPPSLLTFGLDMDAGLLLLTFSEPVRVATLSYTSFSFQNTPDSSSVSYSLTGGLSGSNNGPEIVVTLLDNDLNTLKSVADLATDQNSTYLSATSEAIQDTNANQLSSIPPGSALQVNFYAADTTPPRLVSFTTTLEVRLLLLSFNEPVNASSLQIDQLVLQSQNSNDAIFYQLINGFTNSSNGLSIEVYITEADLNQIEQLNGLFVNMQTAYLRVLSAAIEDTAGNRILTLAPTEAIQTSSYTGNISRPVLLSFDLDMDDGVLTLSFDEPVDSVNFNIDAITLQQQFSVIDVHESFQLTGGFTNLISNTTIGIQLTTDDINQLKSLRIGVSNTSAWLAIDSVATVDDFGVPLQARVNGQSTILVSIYIPDTAQPELMEFSLDLNVGVISQTFSETVDASTFDPTSVTLQNAANNPNTFFTLSVGFQSTGNDQPIQEVTLIREDLNAIKRFFLLATNSNNSYIAIQAGGVLDVFGNPVLEISTEMALQVSEFTSDLTSPVLESYRLDLNAGVLQFVFSETVNVCTFDPTSLQLAGRPFETSSTYTLTGGQTSAENSTQVTLILALDDVNNIKLDDAIATSLSNTFLSVDATLVQDMNNNLIQPVSGVQASQFTEDQLSPTILNFQLNLNQGLLILRFSEPVRVATLNVSGLSLQNTIPLQSHFTSYELTSSFSDGINDPVITIIIISDDLDSIKLIPELATSRDNTYLSVSSGVIQDMNANPNAPIPADSPLQIASLGYIPDSTPPQLESYIANMFVGLLSLTFDEPVNASSVKPNCFTLRAGNLENSTFYQLTGGFINSSNGRLMDLYMTEFDLQQINSESGLFVSMATTYLQFSFDALRDMAGNAIVGLVPSAAVPVTRFIGDSSRPVLESFDLDMNLGILTLSFNENVIHTSLDVGGIILQKEFSVVDKNDYYRLTEGTINPLNSLTVVVTFSTVDINELKSRRIGVSRTSAYLAVDHGAILDEFGEPLLERVNGESTISATSYVPDITPPQVMLFRLDLNSGTLWLSFSETVDANTFDSTSVTLQNAASNPETSFTLSAGSLNSLNDQPLQRLTLSIDDLNEIKRLFPLGATIDTTYLTIISGGVVDVFGNSVVEINSLSALQANEVILDTTPPLLQSFTLDLTNMECQFVFDETINSSSFDPTRLQITGVGSNSYTLTGGEVSQTGNTVRITLLLDVSDVNAIKINDNIAMSLSSTFLQYDEMLVTDVYNNPVEPRLGSSAIQASGFTPDRISPILLRFELDLDTGLLQFLFSEPVRVTTLNPTGITLQSAPLSLSANYQLTGGLTESPNGPNVALFILLDDLNAMKQTTDLTTDVNNTFISITAEIIQDMALNAIASIAADSALQVSVFTPDTTPPELISFELDLRSGGIVILQFSEAVSLNENVLSEIFLQSSEVNASVIVNLTNSLAITQSRLKDRAEITLSPELFEILLNDPSVGASPDTLFITVTEEAINDFNNNSLLPVPSNDALRVTVICELIPY